MTEPVDSELRNVDNNMTNMTPTSLSEPTDALNFDQKYSIEGRFGFEAKDLPFPIHPKDQSGQDTALPMIGVNEDDLSSSPDETSPGEEFSTL